MLTSPNLIVDHRLSLSAQIMPELEKHGDKVAFIDEVTGRETTYRELIVTVKRLGAALLKHGLKPGDVLSISAPNSIEHVFLFFSISMIGAVYHVGDWESSEDLFERQMKICEPTMLVTDHQTYLRIKQDTTINISTLKGIFLIGDQPASGLETLLSLMTDDECRDVSDIDEEFDARTVPFLMYYTGGTTDLSKCVVCSHFYCTYDTMRMRDEQCSVSQPGDVLVITKPMYYASVLTIAMEHFATAGATFILTPDLQLSNLFRAVEMYKVTVLTLASLTELLSGLETGYDVSSVHTVMFGGSSAREGEANTVKERLPTIKQIKQYYGMTEIGAICSISLNDTTRKRVSCGKLVPGNQVKFLRYNTGDEIGPNKIGECYVKSQTPMLCYFKEKEKTEMKVDANGWLRTGDIGYYDEDGYVYIQDRASDIINHVAGQIFPSEINNILLNHPGVVDSATVAVDNPKAGQVPYCFVVPSNKDAVTECMLKQTLHDHILSSIIADIIIEFVEKMPSLGKGQTKQLRQWAKDLSIPRNT